MFGMIYAISLELDCHFADSNLDPTPVTKNPLNFNQNTNTSNALESSQEATSSQVLPQSEVRSMALFVVMSFI